MGAACPYNKLLVAGLVAGLLIAGPRREPFSPWLWTGAALALLAGPPTLIYRIVHHWPKVAMARAIAERT